MGGPTWQDQLRAGITNPRAWEDEARIFPRCGRVKAINVTIGPSEIDIAAARSLIQHVNRAEFCGAVPGTLRLSAVHERLSAVYETRLMFVQCEGLWNNICEEPSPFPTADFGDLFPVANATSIPIDAETGSWRDRPPML